MLFPKQNTSRLVAATLAITTLGFIAWLWRVCDSSSEIYFLQHHAPAEWIMYPKPSECYLLKLSEISGVFRYDFVLKNPPGKSELSLRAMTRWSLAVNGSTVATSTAAKNWKQPSTFDISAQLHPGTNEILVTVLNSNGPPILWLALDAGESKVASGPDWEASLMGAAWAKATVAGSVIKFANGNPFSGAEQPFPSLLKNLPTLLAFVLFSGAVVVLGHWWLKSQQARDETGNPVPAKRFVLMAVAVPVLLWAVLFFNNAGKLPLPAGYDATAHLKYVRYIRTNGKLPLATDGWQMYQPPLYYLISTLLLAPFGSGNFGWGAADMLRCLGFCIGVAHFTLIFLSLRVLFPGRQSLQLFGLTLAAFLPASIYLSHYVTNEALAATFFTAAIYYCLRMLKENSNSRWLAVRLGLCLGASLLTKFTGVIGVPFIAAALFSRSILKAGDPRRIRGDTIGLVFAVTIAICGWHYLRVWRHFGNPLVGNWDPASGYNWWMEDGYHTRSFLFRFGSCLSYPWFSGVNGFADGLYSTLWGDGMWGGTATITGRPPWNYELMAADYLFALLPTLLMLTGTVTAIQRFIRQPDAAWFLLIGVALSTLAALLWMSLKLPSYGQVKAFYGLIAIVPICAFAAVGWEFILRRGKLVLMVAATLLGVWAVNSYASFWIRSWDPETHLTLGHFDADVGSQADAVREYSEALRLAPRSVKIKTLLAIQHTGNDFVEGKRQLETIITETPDDAEPHSMLSLFLAAKKQLNPAIAEARKVVELAPDKPDAYLPLSKLLTDAGRYREAADAGREGLRVSPYSPELQLQTGLAFALLDDQTNAAVHFGHAVSLKPNWPEARDKLGLTLLALRQETAALDQFLQATQLAPGDAAFHDHLGRVLAALKKKPEAIQEYRRVLELNPNFPPALNDLAWILATDPDPQLRNGPAAVELASRACDLTGRKFAPFLGTLAAAYAEAGRFGEAVAFANAAIELGKAAHDSALVSTNLKRIELYRANRPYHQDSP